MELRLLRYFLAVARENSFTRAAKYLHITQPTLSRQLMDLEEELGQKLLNRETHYITLTPEGMRPVWVAAGEKNRQLLIEELWRKVPQSDLQTSTSAAENRKR